ncbi:hypothetical protein ACLOJK_018299 [Asimina triloba]
MASSSSVEAENPCHVLSTSMPSRSHPLFLAIKEEITRLKACMLLSPSAPTLTAKIICNGLSGLKCLYNNVEDLLQLPLSQKIFPNSQHHKWMEDMLDESVRLLDVCYTERNVLLQIKGNVNEFQSTLRRRCGELCLESSVKNYLSSRKKTEKDTCKCFRDLKRTDNKTAFPALLKQDELLSKVVNTLKDVMSITTTILQAILSFLSVSRTTKKVSKLLLVSNLMHKGDIGPMKKDMKEVNELERVDTALLYLTKKIYSKDSETEKMQKAQARLEALVNGIDCLEAGLESMHRCMITSRVSLLNILAH